ncbi:3-dehydroshikimate dehydratase [Poriferisphaera corsica]|uniref:3-dehydroshikimate dehydratase n=1 Tax=Poriferisphaera corsica TaxID=2528020 RepID=A0A517YPR7_9BACT|nr:sugar phosphate isomerase/epimerase [Poriferisphaera corsica]QDU32219.1 3-dehydroshikimate dehydratase [Poriferisphaera corsica]
MASILSAFTDEAAPTIEAQILAAMQCGLTHLDLRSIDDYNITNLPTYIAKEVHAKLSSAGLKVCMFGSPIGKIDIADDFAIDVEKMERLAELSPILGTKIVRIFSYYNAQGQSKNEWRCESIRRLELLIGLAKKHDLILYHENESDIYGDHPDQVLELAELQCEQFRLIYDFANYLRTGEKPMESWGKLRDVTDCFHLKDQRWNNEHTPIGLGDTKAKEILADAVEHGFNGPIIVEPHLTHSEAVLSTHSTGTGDLSLASLTPTETFELAVRTAKSLLDEVGVHLS